MGGPISGYNMRTSHPRASHSSRSDILYPALPTAPEASIVSTLCCYGFAPDILGYGATGSDEDVEGTVHRLDLVLLLLYLHLVEHAILVELKVPTLLPELHVGDVRRIH